MTDSTVPPNDPSRPDDPGSPLPDGASAAVNPTGSPEVPATAWSEGASVVPATAVAKPRRKGLIVGVVVAGAAAIVAAGGVAAYAFLSGGGAQPEDVVSADALAFVKLDLDPAAGQKVALARLAQRLEVPIDPAQEAESPKAIFAGVLEGVTGSDIDYERDLEPWIGSRAALAVFPSADEAAAAGGEPGLLVTVASRDDAAATQALSQLYPADSGWTVVVRDGFAFIGDPATTAPAEQVLADNQTFVGAQDALGDTIAMVYINVDAALDLAEETLPLLEDVQQDFLVPNQPTDDLFTDEFTDEFGDELSQDFFDDLPNDFDDGAADEGVDALGLLSDQFDTIRQQLAEIPSPIGGKAVAVGVAVQPDSVELRARAFGVTEATGSAGAPLAMGSNAVAFLSVDGIDDVLRSALEQAGDAAGDLDEFIDPQQLIDALGTNAQVQVAIDAAGEPLVLGRLSGADPSFWQGIGGLAGLDVTTDGDSVVLGVPGASDALGAPGGEARLLSLLPEASEADVVGYLDVDALEASAASAEVAGDLAQVADVGFTVATPSDGDSTVRLVVRFNEGS